MRILVIGSGGVGSAFAAIVRRREFFESLVLADLVLCAPVLEAEAQAAGVTLEAHYAHLLVHGALHAQGYDHVRARDARVMQARESALVVALGFADPYAR